MKKFLLWTPLVCIYCFLWIFWSSGLTSLGNVNILFVLLVVPVVLLLWKPRHSNRKITITIFILFISVLVLYLGGAIFFQDSEPLERVRSEITLGENNEPHVTLIPDDSIWGDNINTYAFDVYDRHFLLVHDTSALEYDSIGHDFPPTGLYLFEKKSDQYVFLAHQSVGFRGIFSLQGLRYRHSVTDISAISGYRRDYLRLELDFGVFGGSSGSWAEPPYQYTLSWDLYAWDNHWMTDTYDVAWRYSPLRMFSWMTPFSH